MDELTFGFMDPNREARGNSELFVRMRNTAIKSFRNEQVCNLESFADDAIDLSHQILANDIGQKMGRLRDMYYTILSEKNISIRLPDIQSFFLYSFTSGINLSSFLLMEPKSVTEPRQIPADDILHLHFPIRGPEWLCNTANREMPSLENVFCDFQDEILVPIGQTSPMDHRLLADAIAGTLLWAFFGGTYWLKECVVQICESFSLLSEGIPKSGAMCQVKKSMQLIGKNDIQRVLDRYDFFKNLD